LRLSFAASLVHGLRAGNAASALCFIEKGLDFNHNRPQLVLLMRAIACNQFHSAAS
jgi:hypothetical protein